MIDVEKYIKHYSYLVEYSLEDEAYLANCIELRIIAHGSTMEQAIFAIKEATRVHLLMLLEDGDEIPTPSKLQKV